jgi:hypothetical protein
MKLSIWTHWEGRSWSGEIPDAPTARTETMLEYAFRWFNRVDEGDHERMAAVGYDLPSLSAGDVVTLDGERWLCAPTGWERLSVSDPLPPTAELLYGITPGDAA